MQGIPNRWNGLHASRSAASTLQTGKVTQVLFKVTLSLEFAAERTHSPWGSRVMEWRRWGVILALAAGLERGETKGGRCAVELVDLNQPKSPGNVRVTRLVWKSLNKGPLLSPLSGFCGVSGFLQLSKVTEVAGGRSWSVF